VKVAVTFEISDEERLVLGIRANGELAPATREEMEEAIRSYVQAPLGAGVVALRKANADIIERFATTERTNRVIEG